MKKRIFAMTLAVGLLLLCMAGCASQSAKYDTAAADNGSYYTYADSAVYEEMKSEEADYDYASEYPAEAESASDELLSAVGDPDVNRKIIRNANLRIETMDFNGTVGKLQDIVTELNGYISNANVYVYNSYYELHSAAYTVRIPQENFDRFLSYREDIGSVTDTSVWTEDVTDTYYDKQARLDTLETKRTRLLELLEQAEDMEDIIVLESELTDTVYEIERITGSLRHLDDQIAYSTVMIDISEVRETMEPVVLPKTLGERISQQFHSTMAGLSDFCEDFVVWFVGALPVLVILAVIAVVMIVLIRRGAPKRAARRELRAAKRAEKNAEAMARWRKAHDTAPKDEEKK